MLQQHRRDQGRDEMMRVLWDCSLHISLQSPVAQPGFLLATQLSSPPLQAGCQGEK